VDLTVTLTDAQLEAIAHRVAELLADQRPSESSPELLTVAQAAKLAGVSEKTVRNWLSTHRLTRHGAPRTPRVARGELLALINQQPVSDGRTARPRRPRRPQTGPGTFARMAREV
jgi:hypothetical protein